MVVVTCISLVYLTEVGSPATTSRWGPRDHSSLKVFRRNHIN